MEECLIVTWTRDGHPAMQYAAVCADAEMASRVFQRLSDAFEGPGERGTEGGLSDGEHHQTG